MIGLTLNMIYSALYMYCTHRLINIHITNSLRITIAANLNAEMPYSKAANKKKDSERPSINKPTFIDNKH